MNVGEPAVQATKPDPRYNQKMRTRQAVIVAARELVESGKTPTVPEAADAALVSRATAYRYFPTQAALLVEAALLPGLPTADMIFGSENAPTDVGDRVALVSDVMFRHISSLETEFRLFLREQLLRSIDPGGGELTHAGFRLPLIDAALQPISAKLSPLTLERLRSALGVLIGTEAVIACRDVLGLDEETATTGMSWACRALVAGALAETRAESRKTAAGRRKTS